MQQRVGLNLGCGEDYLDDAVNVDISPNVGADIVHDLNDTPWPFDADRFEWVRARHVLEHLDPVPWSELQRVIQPGGRFELTYPIGWTRFEDATHKQFWTVETAMFIIAPRNHGHEAPLSGKLHKMNVEWNLRPSNLYRSMMTRLREFVYGPGAWMGQVTGLYGEVRAVYKIK